MSNLTNETGSKLIKTAEEMIVLLDKSYEMTHKLEANNASRMAWLVGIAGFSIINLPNVFKQSYVFSFYDFAFWIMIVFFGVLAHWFHRNIEFQNFNVYLMKREQFLLFVVNGIENAKFDNLNMIVKNETIELKQLSTKHERAVRFAVRFEQLTILSFIVALGFFIYKFVIFSLK